MITHDADLNKEKLDLHPSEKDCVSKIGQSLMKLRGGIAHSPEMMKLKGLYDTLVSCISFPILTSVHDYNKVYM